MTSTLRREVPFTRPALTASALFPPQDRKKFHKAVLKEILDEPAASSRNRRNQRGVKRKMSSFPLRRHSDYEVSSIAASPAAESPEIASGMDLSTLPSRVLV